MSYLLLTHDIVRYCVVVGIPCPIRVHRSWNLRPTIAVVMVFISTLLGSGRKLDVQYRKRMPSFVPGTSY